MIGLLCLAKYYLPIVYELFRNHNAYHNHFTSSWSPSVKILQENDIKTIRHKGNAAAEILLIAAKEIRKAE